MKWYLSVVLICISLRISGFEHLSCTCWLSWSRKWQPTPVFLPGKFCGQKSLSVHGPCGCRVRHSDWACMQVWPFLLLFAWNTITYPFTLNLCVSLVLKWVSCRQSICVCVLSCLSWVWLFVTSWTVAFQRSMGFSRQDYWSGFLFPPL